MRDHASKDIAFPRHLFSSPRDPFAPRLAHGVGGPLFSRASMQIYLKSAPAMLPLWLIPLYG